MPLRYPAVLSRPGASDSSKKTGRRSAPFLDRRAMMRKPTYGSVNTTLTLSSTADLST